jgi:hypothetical protein
MSPIEEKFTNVYTDYLLVTEYLRKVLPILTGNAPVEQARLYMTERDKTGYTITGYGNIAASDGLSGLYELKLAVENGEGPTIVYLQSVRKIALGDAPFEA